MDDAHDGRDRLDIPPSKEPWADVTFASSRYRTPMRRPHLTAIHPQRLQRTVTRSLKVWISKKSPKIRLSKSVLVSSDLLGLITCKLEQFCFNPKMEKFSPKPNSFSLGSGRSFSARSHLDT